MIQFAFLSYRADNQQVRFLYSSTFFFATKAIENVCRKGAYCSLSAKKQYVLIDYTTSNHSQQWRYIAWVRPRESSVMPFIIKNGHGYC